VDGAVGVPWQSRSVTRYGAGGFLKARLEGRILR
jgi:hypothetical protein